jgi:hypothetical protein
LWIIRTAFTVQIKTLYRRFSVTICLTGIPARIPLLSTAKRRLFLLTAVKPRLQGSGLNGVVMEHLYRGCVKRGIKCAETGPQLENNTKVHSQWKMFEVEPHKRRRCYIKKI